MDQPNCGKPTRLQSAWGGLRSFYRAWRDMRDARYRYLAEVLGESPVTPRKTAAECSCRKL